LLALSLFDRRRALRIPPGQGGPVDHGLFSLLASLIVLVSASCAGWLGVLLGAWYRVRVWVDGAVHRARRERIWPPPYQKRNCAKNVLLTTVVIPSVVFNWLVLPLMVGIILGVGPEIWGLMSCGSLGISLFVLAVLIDRREIIKHRLFAATPDDCWGIEEVRAIP
jgi:hypothetical protein